MPRSHQHQQHHQDLAFEQCPERQWLWFQVQFTEYLTRHPDFDANQSAFYYARVIEIPTPRWTAYEALRFGIKMTDNVPMTTQERAYTSAIWYTPGN